MGRKALIQRQLKRKLCVERYREKRDALRSILSDKDASPEDRVVAMKLIQKLPRYSVPVGMRNFCLTSHRTGGYYRIFAMSRIELRKNALKGFLPGVVKSSW